MADPDTCHIRLAGPYAPADLNRLLTTLAPLDELERRTPVRIDLSDLERISAHSVAVLGSTATASSFWSFWTPLRARESQTSCSAASLRRSVTSRSVV